MDAFSLGRAVVDGLVISIGLGLLVLLSIYINPRIWFPDFPAAVQAALPPMNTMEKRQRAVFAVILIGSMLGTFLLSTWRLRVANGGELSFVTAFLHIYLLSTIFNLFDTLVLDWLVLGTLRPRWAIPPGAEDMPNIFPTNDDNRKAFVKGLWITALISLPLAFVITL
jgi:hypothetical protein